MRNGVVKKKFELLAFSATISICVTEFAMDKDFPFVVDCTATQGTATVHGSIIGSFDSYKRAEKVAFETFNKIMQRLTVDAANSVVDAAEKKK